MWVPTRGVGISGFSNLRASNLLIYIYFLLLASEIKPDRVSKKTLPEGLVRSTIRGASPHTVVACKINKGPT